MKILLVSVESPWPCDHGGRIRTARIAEQLGRHFDLLAAFPDHGLTPSDAPVATHALAWSAPAAIRTRASHLPHVGGYQLSPSTEALTALAAEFDPDLIYWSHSYLAAWSPPGLSPIPQVVEFANIESHRLRSLVTSGRGRQKLGRAAEAAKAAFWEPRVAKRASLCIALSQPDHDVLRRWASRTMLIPNGVEEWPYEPSPAAGYVLALASYDYEPNVVAINGFVRDTWPHVRAALPQAHLVVAGRRSEALAPRLSSTPGVSVLGTLDDVTAAYAGAAVTLAPASSGGGSQLKLTESFSRGRSVVMSSFAARGLPQQLRSSGWIADAPVRMAGTIVDALTDVPARHARESAAWRQCASLTWSGIVGDLVKEIETLGERGRAR